MNLSFKPVVDALDFLLTNHATATASPQSQQKAHTLSGGLHDFLAAAEKVVHVAESVLPIVLPEASPIIAIAKPVLDQFEHDFVDQPVVGNQQTNVPVPAPALANVANVSGDPALAKIEKELQAVVSELQAEEQQVK